MFQRSWVRILAHFLTLICCKNCTVSLKRLKINEKEAGVGPFKKNLNNIEVSTLKTKIENGVCQSSED